MSGWTFFFLWKCINCYNSSFIQLQLYKEFQLHTIVYHLCACYGGSICKNINLVTGIYTKIYTWASIGNVW